MEGELDFEDEDDKTTLLKKKASAISQGEAAEEGEDDGEISDEDDLEEGEVKDSSSTAKPPARQVCRFFNRGQCTWGNLCRFLHLSVNEKGHYNMFAPNPKHSANYVSPESPFSISSMANISAVLTQKSGPKDFIPSTSPPVLSPLPTEVPPAETAWERGLRHAKELMKNASKRKEQEPDFEEKRLNLGIEENIRNAVEYDKENSFYGKTTYRKPNEMQIYPYEEGLLDNGEREAREHWREGRYENFEIRWTRQEKDHRNKERLRIKGVSSESWPQDTFPANKMSMKKGSPTQWANKTNSQNPLKTKEKWRDERLSEIQSLRPRADEWRDPWRRSKSPASRSRSRCRSGSYSSVSSCSYSERSSRSSYSYTPSSSHSSYSTKSNSRSRSYSKSHSISSHSFSHTRSHSYSRSLSMDSVSSASSTMSLTSSGSGSLKGQNKHASVLRKEGDGALTKLDSDSTTAPSKLFEEVQTVKPEKEYETHDLCENKSASDNLDTELKPVGIQSLCNLQYLLPTDENVFKEPSKHNIHKQQIKLTLLKTIPNKTSSLERKELDRCTPFQDRTTKCAEKDDNQKCRVTNQVGIKRPLTPPSQLHGFKSEIHTIPKRSASSRRDELLKQLKAVEDAIARKRAKLS